MRKHEQTWYSWYCPYFEAAESIFARMLTIYGALGQAKALSLVPILVLQNGQLKQHHVGM